MEYQKKNRPPPDWTTTFRCYILQDDLPLDTLQDIAGRQQSRAQAVHALTYHQTMQMYLQLFRAAQTAGRNPSRHELLEEVYRRTGKTVLVDGQPVCLPAPAFGGGGGCGLAEGGVGAGHASPVARLGPWHQKAVPVGPVSQVRARAFRRNPSPG